MLFKFKQRPIVLDAFTVNPIAYNAYPIVPAIKAAPDWWKNLPVINRNSSEPSNMKMCPGFVNLYQQGFMIKFSADTKFVVEDAVTLEHIDFSKNAFPHLEPKVTYGENARNGEPNGLTAKEMILSHPKSEREGWASDYENYKIHIPWVFNCKKYTKFLLIQPGYSNMESPDWFTPPGVIDFKYNSVIDVQLMINRVDSKVINFQAGSPLCHLIPLTDRKVELKLHLVSDEEIRKVSKLYWTFGKFQGGYVRTTARLEGGK